MVCSWNISSNTVLTSHLTILRSVTRKHFKLCVSYQYSHSLHLSLPTTVKGSTASLGGSYADECGRTGFLLTCGGLCGDVLSVLHLSHSGLSCLSTPSPVWPRFEGTDVNHWFAIGKLNISLAFRESRPVWIETGDGSTSSRSVLHLAMHNFRRDNGPCVGSCVCVCLTFDLRLTVRMCCRPEESTPFSCNVWNAVSIKSSLKMEAAHTSTHPYTERAINQHLFTEKGKHNSVKRH